MHAHEPSHHHGKARFDHPADTGSELAERDSHTVPQHRPMYEKDENGVYQFAGAPADPSSLIRNQSKLFLASLNDPAGSGSGPRSVESRSRRS
jgi:hypothetical protein